MEQEVLQNQNKKKKVLHLITKSNWGGAQKYLFLLATNFNQWENVVGFGENEFQTEGVFEDKLKASNIRIVKIKGMGRDIGLFKDIKSFQNIRKTIKIEKPDLIHLNSSKMGILGALAVRLSFIRTKVVFTVHGLPFLEDRPYWQNLIIKVLTYLTFLLADENIVLSKREFGMVGNWPLVKDKIKIVYNGMEKPSLKPKQDTRREISGKYKIEISEDEVLIGNISEMTKNKGLDDTLKVLKILKRKGLKFKYLHWGTGVLENELKNKSVAFGLKGQVHFLGFDENAKVYLPALDIFFFTSIKEGLPYVVLEAGLSGVCICATRVGALPEIIKSEVTGILMAIGGTDEMATKMSDLILNKSKRETFAKKNKEEFEKNFLLEQMLEKTKKVYIL